MKTIIMSLLFLIGSAQAGTVGCDYNFGNNSISLGFVPSTKTIKREFKSNGLRYVVNIKDIRQPNEVEDYITIEDQKRRKITYTLKCRTAEAL
ncbi:MAG: hypothetical protein HC840_16910 [Leptolyngbyaceae cyanobacterium RM2_2_4]|nr:hypothetical protein [Leptolyngbyaceae cyanobacterium RM2_2_4]